MRMKRMDMVQSSLELISPSIFANWHCHSPFSCQVYAASSSPAGPTYRPFGSAACHKERVETMAVGSRRFTRMFLARLVAFPGSFTVLHNHTAVSGIITPGNMVFTQLSHLF